MTPERWARMKDLYSAALEKPAGERDGFLDQACPDAALRDEVRKLFEAEQFASLQSPVPRILGPLVRPASIGRYRIVRLLGEGGMGSVYEAEQDQPRRRVAVKAIKPGLVSDALLRRFEHEAQALGRLHHPGIAQIFEAGAADAGFGPQPYFAMEFIEGTSLLRYAEEHRLSARERLGLMVKVCEAVHHAHQRGIIHRDLKPGNILVDESGQPKIVDFGVARMTDADALATRQTDFGQILGTLAYMSPEQVLADPLELDTRSDVYALGVILYQLLAGRLPYRIGEQLTRAVETIREEDPAPLSTIDRAYRGDIETIVGKALEKDKTRRYSSAAELAADIQRHLSDEPIVARRSTALYQVRKFARRHKVYVAAAAAAFVMLAAGVVASTWEAARARRAEREAIHQRDAAAAAQRTAQSQRDRALTAEAAAEQQRNRALAEKRHADAETATATAISAFLRNDLLAQASVWSQAARDKKPDPDLKVRTALDRAAARIAGKFVTQPLVEASLLQTMGQSYKDLGLYAEAERHLGRALALRLRALGEPHPDTLETMQSLALVDRDQGKYQEAESLLTRVVATRRRARGESDLETANAMAALAAVYRTEGKYPPAEPLYATTLRVRRKLLGEDHPDTLSAINDLAVLYFSEGKYVDAESLFIRVLDARKRTGAEHQADTLVTKGNLADTYRLEGRYALSEPLFLDVLAERRRVLGEEHPLTLTTMEALASLYSLEGKYALSESTFSTVLEARRRTLGPRHPSTLTAMNDLAVLYTRERQFTKAEALLTEVLEARRTLNGEQNPSTLSAMSNLAEAYREQGKYSLAEPLFLHALEIRRRAYSEEHPGTLTIADGLAVLYRLEGKYTAAEPLQKKVLETRRRTLGAEHPATLTAMTNLAALYAAQGRYAEAEPLETAALDSRRRTLGEDHPSTVASRAGLAILYQEQRKYAEAEPLLADVLSQARRVLGADHPATRECLTALARVRLARRQYPEAEALLRETLEGPAAGNPRLWQPFERRSLLGLALLEQAKFAEAEPLLIEAYRGLVERQSTLPAALSPGEAGERIVRLYTVWAKPSQAAEWTAELARQGMP